MKSFHLTLLLFLAVGLACTAQTDKSPAALPRVQAPFTESWLAVRDKRPAGLHLTLSLPKTHFYLGEVIPAKLTFSNETQNAYHLAFGSGSRAGRTFEIGFRAEGNDGSAVNDPLQWYFDHFPQMSGGGPGIEKRSELWEVTIAANQWLQFPKPGAYKIYAWSSRMAPGEKNDPRDRQFPGIELVSDPVEITIDPLSAERENTIIEQAVKVLAGSYASTIRRGSDGDEPALEAMERLRFLQTTAACAALLQFVDSTYGEEAMLSFYARPDRAASTAEILAAVREGRLGLSDNLEYLYSGLKNGNDWGPGRQAAAVVAREELFAAARRTITDDGAGDAFFTSLLALFRKNPLDPTIRAIMIKRQLDLPQKQIDEVFSANARFLHKELLSLFTGKDFLPLLRRLVKPDKHNPNALEALASVAPDEARPIIIEDIKRSQPIYILAEANAYYPPAAASFALRTLPDRELPELDSTLREKLSQPVDQPNLEATMVLIERYGTKALLPEVVKLYQTNEGHWQCVLQASVLRYWIRCDHAAGVEALSRALGKNAAGETGCFQIVLTDVLQNAWVDEALPVVLSAMGNDDSQVVRSAATLLEAHAGPEAIDNIISAIERVTTRPPPEKTLDRRERVNIPRGMTRLLIESKRWKLSRPQLERLQKVVTDNALQTRLKKMLAGQEK